LLAANADRAAALMLQQLPQTHPGDSDGWARASALFNTLSASELLDLQGETLLWRLFHDEGVRILNQQPLSFACSCSRARVEDMLRSLGLDEALAACAPGQAEIHCDFCGQSYQFSSEQVTGLFQKADANAPGSPLLQ